MKISKFKLEIIKRFGSQERFSIASGINESIISKIVRGVRKPTAEQKEIIERLLKTPADTFFNEGDQIEL